MKDPQIIIMDEPTLGIDPHGMHELTALIRDLSVKDGRTILISSHELYQVQEISDRVGIFVSGKMIACGKISELGEQLKRDGITLTDGGSLDEIYQLYFEKAGGDEHHERNE